MTVAQEKNFQVMMQEAFQNLEFLIADTSPSRKSIRTLIGQMGAKPTQIAFADQRDSIPDLLKKKPADVIFLDYDFLNAGTFQLVESHIQNNPDNRPRIFFLLTSNESRALAGKAAESEIDAVLTKPFTFDGLTATVTEVFQRRLFPSDVQKSLDQAKHCIRSKNFQEALDTLEKGKMLGEPTALLHCYEGEAFRGLLQLQSARDRFELGLALHPNHYKCLMGLLELTLDEKNHQAAYALSRQIADNHVVPLDRLPDFIRLSILNHQYNDIVGFYELADRVAEGDQNLAIYLAAGLVVCGLYFLQISESQNAVNSFKKAEKTSEGKPKIVERILIALRTAGLEAEMKPFLDRAPKEVKDSPALYIATLQHHVRKQEIPEALKLAIQLIQNKILAPQIFHMAITLSQQSKRKQSSIDELVYLAMDTYKDQKEEFEKYLGAPVPPTQE